MFGRHNGGSKGKTDKRFGRNDKVHNLKQPRDQLRQNSFHLQQIKPKKPRNNNGGERHNNSDTKHKTTWNRSGRRPNLDSTRGRAEKETTAENGDSEKTKILTPPRALSQVAEAIFTSKIRYGLALYFRPRISENDQSNGTLKQITKYQNDVMRIITGKKCRDKVSIESLRKTTGTTSVNHLLCYHILIDMFNILKDTASATMKEMLTKKLGNSNITTRSTTQNKVTVPVNFGKKNDFAYYGTTLWNLLPEHIRNAETAEQIRNAKSTKPEAINSQQTCKAKMLREQKLRLKNAFKAYIKKWINDKIPSD